MEKIQTYIQGPDFSYRLMVPLDRNYGFCALERPISVKKSSIKTIVS